MKHVHGYKSTLFNKRIISNPLLIKTFSLFISLSLFLITFTVTIQASSGSIERAPSKANLKSEGKVRIAVLDMEARGISNLEAKTLSEHLRAELLRTGVVYPISSIKINKVLEEAGYTNTGKSSAEWVREAGKILDVDQVMKGSLGKLGESFIIDARIFAVGTGAIKKSITRAYRGKADGLIMEIEKLAWEVAGVVPKIGKVTKKSQPSKNFPTLAENVSRSVIQAPTAKALQVSSNHSKSPNKLSNEWQIQSKSLSKTLFSKLEGNPRIMLGGSVLSYFLVKGLATIVSQSNRKSSSHEIGMPPSFPEVPTPPGM